MFSVVPTSAVLPAEKELHELLASAKATADAIVPYLTLHTPDGATEACAIRKVASCQRFYSALLRSDGTLLLLTNAAAGDSLSSLSTRAARVSVLDSGGEAVQDVAAGASHIVYCTVSGAVYSCGYDNTYGQLGDGTVWSSSSSFASSNGARTDEVRDIPALSAPKRIVGFGGDGTGGRLSDSWVDASVSSSAEGAAGDSQKAGAQPLAAAAAAVAEASPPKRYVPPASSRRIRQVACGLHHTLLLTHTGRCVYGCGRGNRGELGGARAVLAQPSFRSVSLLFGLEMRQVAAADAHSFALLENGLLYAFGDNTCGQLGLGHTTRVSQPTLVPLLGQAVAAVRPPYQPLDSEAATASGSTTRPLRLDEKAYSSLRAAYGSAESTYYPLRVPRLQADRIRFSEAACCASANAEVDDAQVRWVHCCGSWTLLETNRCDVWLSCGTALTRGVPLAAQASISGVPATQAARIDGCGVLGRPFLKGDKTVAYQFFPVRWPSLIKTESSSSWDVRVAPLDWAHGEMSNKSSPSRSLGAQRSDELEERTVPRHCTTTPSEAIAIHNNTSSEAPHRPSDTEPSLGLTKKTVRGEENCKGTRVCPYPTSLFVLLGDEEDGAGAAKEPARDVHTGLLSSKLLVQSGAPEIIAVEVQTKDAAAWEIVTGRAADAAGAASGVDVPDRIPSGASLVGLHSSHGQFIPLPTYALFV